MTFWVIGSILIYLTLRLLKKSKKNLTRKQKTNKRRKDFIKIILDEIISSKINEKHP